MRVRSIWVAAVLLLGTLVAGAATQGRVGTGTPSGGGAAHFHSDGDRSVRVTGHLDRTAVLQGEDGLVRMELTLAAAERDIAAPVRRPTDLVVILDRSGSMQGDKIAHAKAAIHQLLSQLGAQDRFGLVSFSSQAQVTLPLARASREASTGWSATVDALRAGGGTYMDPALRLGLGMIDAARDPQRVARVVLISDGLAAEPAPVLRAQAVRAAHGEYSLSAVGVGADFNETLMSSLADAGTGNYYYLQDASALEETFLSEFESARQTLASGLSVTLRPGRGVAVVDAARYPLERADGAVTFRPGTLFAGQERRLGVTLRVPTGGAAEFDLGRIEVAWTEAGEPHRVVLDGLPRVACVETQDDFYASLDADVWSRSVVSDEYGALKVKVAELVRSGRRDAAVSEIQQFRERNERLNAQVAAPAVREALADTVQLEQEVDDAFEGTDQAHKQNLLGKRLHALGYQDLR